MKSSFDETTHGLIVGIPRSGTTLLTSLMGAHPDCIAMSECKSCEENRVVSPARVLLNKLCCPNQVQFNHPFSAVSRSEFTRKLIQKLSRKLWSRPITYFSGSVPLDSPSSAMSISEYVEERNARIIIILRDPDQIIYSQTRRAGLTERKAASRWAHGLRELEKAYEEYKSVCYIISLADLVKSASSQLKNVSDFLNLGYMKEMLEGYNNTPQYERSCLDNSVVEKNVPEYGLEDDYPIENKIYERLRNNISR